MKRPNNKMSIKIVKPLRLVYNYMLCTSSRHSDNGFHHANNSRQVNLPGKKT